jgi:hypothetical protein
MSKNKFVSNIKVRLQMNRVFPLYIEQLYPRPLECGQSPYDLEMLLLELLFSYGFLAIS